MKGKKWLVLALSACMLTSFVACGDNGDEGGDNAGNGGGNNTENDGGNVTPVEPVEITKEEFIDLLDGVSTNVYNMKLKTDTQTLGASAEKSVLDNALGFDEEQFNDYMALQETDGSEAVCQSESYAWFRDVAKHAYIVATSNSEFAMDTTYKMNLTNKPSVYPVYGEGIVFRVSNDGTGGAVLSYYDFQNSSDRLHYGYFHLYEVEGESAVSHVHMVGGKYGSHQDLVYMTWYGQVAQTQADYIHIDLKMGTKEKAIETFKEIVQSPRTKDFSLNTYQITYAYAYRASEKWTEYWSKNANSTMEVGTPLLVKDVTVYEKFLTEIDKYNAEDVEVYYDVTTYSMMYRDAESVLLLGKIGE